MLEEGVSKHRHELMTVEALPGPTLELSRPVVQLIVVTNRKPLRHRQNALAVAKANQPRYVKRTHPPPCLVPQPVRETASASVRARLSIR